jgi:N-acyl-D-aspartate/D-glutamate deacylase
VDYFLANPEEVGRGLFAMDERFDYEPDPRNSLLARAHREQRGLLDVIYDELLADDGNALLYFPVYNYALGNLDAVHEMLRHPMALSGLSDGGAHVGTICDASFPTFMLSHWARDRAAKRQRVGFSVPEVVHMLTQKNARFMGLHDRGVIREGLRADLNIIDMERLTLHRPRIEADLPAGGKRLLQDATGYLATICGGQVITERGQLTSARPGALVRAG